MKKFFQTFVPNTIVGIILAVVLMLQDIHLGIELNVLGLSLLGGFSGSFLTQVVKTFFGIKFSWLQALIGGAVATLLVAVVTQIAIS